ncbi:MAG: anaerobic ribonucleoside-triphosphate reductase activating protein [Verrucomicrobia bacterium]|jgi:pyruvate formate lyase activating enzyme|nr:anaerobic ribonucleoside-triphosphate reductase activating protein [Verrucomicrobiota bacterium]
MNLDELSPVYAYLQNPSMVDYAGHLSAVFFTTGCNFKCGFCHNAPLMGTARPGMSWSKLQKGCQKFVADWVDGAVITGGEPTLSEALPELIRFLKRFGWSIKLDTNGSNPEMLLDCLPLVDYVAMDVKAGVSGYPALTGYDDMDCLRRSIGMIKDSGKDHEFRTTVLEPFHDDAQMREISELISGARRYIVQPFVPSENLPEARYRQMARTSAGRLEAVAALVAGCADEVSVRGG